MKDTIVFDIETQKSFDEVGGRNNLHLLGVAVLAAYSYERGKTFVFEEKNLNQFQKMIDATETIIGFNSKDFDIPILRHNKIDFGPVLSVDLMEDIKNGVGFRVGLDNIAKTTLGAAKSADGLQAIRWYKEGKIDEIKKYCVKDVLITRDIYEYGKKQGHILFLDRNKAKIAVPVSWGGIQKDIRHILERAYKERKSAEIDYVTHSPDFRKSDSAKNIRLIDIYSINQNFIEAYCHLRQATRIFKINRILKAKVSDHSYRIETDIQKNLMSL